MSDSTERKKVILGVTGSIAAYKSVELARLLVSRGFEVMTIMSEAAEKFVGKLTFETITKNPVFTTFWDASNKSEIEHIGLADWADLIVIAPATADTIAKLAYGFAENPLLATVLASKAKILVAPAMNTNMYENPQTQANINSLKKRGFRFVDPEVGELACGWNGSGRLADPWQIFFEVQRSLSPLDLVGKKVLVTTGPTREPLDPVRYVSNRSSGKMGVALAREAFRRGADVTLVHGPVYVRVPSLVNKIPVNTASEMYLATIKQVEDPKSRPDIIIMAAAVADYRPKEIAKTKIKKQDEKMQVNLDRNPDILSKLGELKANNKFPLLVGFAVETGELEDLLSEARSKLDKKNADLIVGNFAADSFDLNTNRVWLVDRSGRQDEIATTYKSRIAIRIIDAVLKML